MSALVIITYGEDNQSLDTQSLKAVVEVRVEQEMSKPYRYAIRFEDHVCEGKIAISTQSNLQPGTIIGVFVKEGDADAMRCLVRGPIDKIKSSVATGGSGSWFECHGLDMRAMMGVTEYSATWTGFAHTHIENLISDGGFTPDVEDTTIEYDTRNKLTQSGTNLAFCEKVAKENNFEFWVSYSGEVITQAADGSKTATVTETLHFKHSPSDMVPGASDSLITIPLLPDTSDLELIVNPSGEDECKGNTLSSEMDIAAERVTAAYFTAQRDGNLEPSQAFSGIDPPDDPANSNSPANGNNAAEVVNEQRLVVVEPTGSVEEQRLRAEAELAESRWFIQAKCSTAQHLLGRSVFPHDIAFVKGVSHMHIGTYQITKVVHVVTQEHHLMDLTLRRNTFNFEPQKAETDTSLRVANA